MIGRACVVDVKNGSRRYELFHSLQVFCLMNRHRDFVSTARRLTRLFSIALFFSFLFAPSHSSVTSYMDMTTNQVFS